MDKATRDFLSQPGYSNVVQPTMQPTTVMGYSPSVWDYSYYEPQGLPSLPGGSPSTIDPNQWTAQAFGANQYSNQPKSVTTTAITDPNYGYNKNAINEAFSLFTDPITAAFQALEQQTGGKVSTGGKVASGGQVSSGVSSGSKAASGGWSGGGGGVQAGVSGSYADPEYGSQVQLANGQTGNYMSPGLALDQNGNYVGYSDSSNSGGSGSCYITTAAVGGFEADDGPTLTALRWFRDNIMGGRSEVSEYYATAPAIVAWINARPDRDRVYAIIRRRVLAPCVKMIMAGKHLETYRLYARMVRFLRARANG